MTDTRNGGTFTVHSEEQWDDRVAIMLTPEQSQYLRSTGDGDISAGIRRLIDEAQRP